jgi:hypothetical protein
VTHIRHQQDADLHDENGEHISTPPSTDGTVLVNYQRRIEYHLWCHEHEGDGYPSSGPAGSARDGRADRHPQPPGGTR